MNVYKKKRLTPFAPVAVPIAPVAVLTAMAAKHLVERRVRTRKESTVDEAAAVRGVHHSHPSNEKRMNAQNKKRAAVFLPFAVLPAVLVLPMVPVTPLIVAAAVAATRVGKRSVRTQKPTAR